MQKVLAVSRCILLVLALLCVGRSVRAQDWTRLGSLPANARCGYFWDNNHGVVGVYNIKFNYVSGQGIYYYNNGVWTAGKYPEALDMISSIRQLKPGVLYATGGVKKIWVSTDSGKNWGLTTTSSNAANDVYLTPDSVLHTCGGTFARLNDTICINTNGTPSYSRDGGVTWKYSSGIVMPSGESYGSGSGCYADLCRGVFFVPDAYGDVFVSVDSGATWKPVNTSPYENGYVNAGILDGGGGMIYMQAINGGLYESADIGGSWQRTHGPGASSANVRIFCFPNGGNVITFSGNDVWFGTGMNVTLHPASPITFRDWAITDCVLSHVQLLIWPTGIAYPLHFLAVGNDLHDVYPNDTTIMTSALDTTFVVFHITKPGLHGTGDILIHAAPTTPCWPIASWDTLFSDTNATIADLQIHGSVDTVKACDSVDVPVAISSMFCDSLSVIASIVQQDSLQPLSFLSPAKMSVMPGDNDTIWLHYAPHGNPEDRSYTIHLTSLLTPSNITIDTNVTVHLTALPDKRCNQETVKASVEEAVSSFPSFDMDGKILWFNSKLSPMNGEMEVVNILGAVVARRRLPMTAGPWDLSALSSGMYVLRLLDGDRSTAIRFVFGN